MEGLVAGDAVTVPFPKSAKLSARWPVESSATPGQGRRLRRVESNTRVGALARIGEKIFRQNGRMNKMNRR